RALVAAGDDPEAAPRRLLGDAADIGAGQREDDLDAGAGEDLRHRAAPVVRALRRRHGVGDGLDGHTRTLTSRASGVSVRSRRATPASTVPTRVRAAAG